jgi:3-hydroxybutyrate dehydrogenase
MPELMGHHAIVTGAGSGAGEAIALALAGKGARVTAIGRRLAPLEALAAQDDRIIAVSADVTDADAMASAIAEAVETERGADDRHRQCRVGGKRTVPAH